MQGKMDAIDVAIGMVLTDSTPRRIATAALKDIVRPAAAPVTTTVDTAIDELSNNELGAKALGLVAEISALTDTYREMSQSISQQHLHELEKSYRLKSLQTPRTEHDPADKWAAIDKDIARLRNPDSFRQQKDLADVNAIYVEKALRNLQRTINAFEAYHQTRAQLYRDKMLSCLPAGVANARINYDQPPLSPAQIIAIADDLERLSKLLTAAP